MRICYSAIKFFYLHVVRRDWHLLKIIRAPTEKRLPSVLSREEVNRILGNVTTFHNYAYLSTVYFCGLRLQEGLFLQVSDIDGVRKFIHIHRKGTKYFQQNFKKTKILLPQYKNRKKYLNFLLHNF